MRHNINPAAEDLNKELIALTIDANYDYMSFLTRSWYEVSGDASKAVRAYQMRSPATADKLAVLAATARAAAAADGRPGSEILAHLTRIAEIADALAALV